MSSRVAVRPDRLLSINPASRGNLRPSRHADTGPSAKPLLEPPCAEQGQTTERFGRAVEQLGNRALDVRVGGIYALERIMHDSPQDQPAIIDVLTAFVRGHSAQRGSPPLITDVGAERLLPAALADIQAALNVIGRRDHTRNGSHKIDLSYAKLFGADLSDAYLVGADLEGVDLTGATMFRANLTKAHLLNAKLSYTACRWANFSNAGMVKAVLTNTFLYDAKLDGAVLQFATLNRTFLGGATLQGTDLRHATITNPSGANFAGAVR
ncbi:pentapeptide repeat-containing protein [Nonomuraea sp. NPDC005692]|uniref:pentapeptide repeat-containing protein n=1 Tax=Nonomuraea sp. NPDC005692 TaxID=3157168 RepID=UPI0033E1AFB2